MKLGLYTWSLIPDVNSRKLFSIFEVAKLLAATAWAFKASISNVKPDVEFTVDEISMLPKERITLQGEDLEIFNKLLTMLDEVDDVQNVYHNVEL